MTRRYGALPDSSITQMIEGGFIQHCRGTPSPASLDLHVSGECYRIKGSFLPKHGEQVFTVAKDVGLHPYDISNPLTVGETYLIPVEEKFALTESVYAYANPKSSTGRNDVHVRLVADGVPAFDALNLPNYKGKVWVIVNPNSYPVLMHEGLAVTQLRFFNGDTRLSGLDMEFANTRENPFLCDSRGDPITHEQSIRGDDGSLILTVDLSAERAGYVAKHTQEVFDFNAPVRSVDWRDFFEEVHIRKGLLEMGQNRFYLLSTAQYPRVPPEYACEAVDLDSRSGDFRAHYAGFIDPGWGYGINGEGRGRMITLEVRSSERRLCFRHGQSIARFRYERMLAVPEKHYDVRDTSNYRIQQGARLSKHFTLE